MKFGIFYELQLPRPWVEGDELKLYQNALTQLETAGRCEFGMGESASITELTPFGRDMETKREVFEEAVQAIFPMFTKIGTEHHGKYFDIPLRNVVPKPVQKPHPPLWMACSQLPTIERA